MKYNLEIKFLSKYTEDITLNFYKSVFTRENHFKARIPAEDVRKGLCESKGISLHLLLIRLEKTLFWMKNGLVLKIFCKKDVFMSESEKRILIFDDNERLTSPKVNKKI